MKSALPTAALLLALGSTPLAAQSGWVLDLSVGHVSYQNIGARIETASAMAGVRQGTGARGWTYLYGGVPLQAGGVAWGAGGMGRRLAVGRGTVTAGIDLGAQLLGYRNAEAAAAGGASTLEMLPVLAVRRGAVGVEIRSGMLQHTDFYEQARLTRRIHDSGARAGVLLHQGLGVQADVRYLRAPEGDHPYLGGGVEAERGAATAWVSMGRWLSDTIPTPEYGIGIGWKARERWELRAAWQQEASSPLYWNPPRRGWNVQVSRRLGKPPARIAAAPVVRDAEGRIAIRLAASEAPSAPSVLGEFTGWLPVPMTREGDFWMARFVVAPGVYRYGFQDAGGQWFLPGSLAYRMSDGMGGESAVLIVP